VRIGLDFDNTIADYDRAFSDVARSIGIKTEASSKKALKTELLSLRDGESTWQKIQGLTYGPHISRATLFSGVAEFIYRARLLGHDLFIVSHKTEFGHFDESRTPLRLAAQTWLVDNGIVGTGSHQIDRERVFFGGTRDQKVAHIRALDLDVFVDDLAEVLADEAFPLTTRRVLFGASEQDVKRDLDAAIFASLLWDQIAIELLGDFDAESIATLAQAIWPTLKIDDAEFIYGRGNSRILKLNSVTGPMALKIYPNLTHDSRPRRVTEWSASEFLAGQGFPVPSRRATSLALNWSAFDWVSGASPNAGETNALIAARDFVKRLKMASNSAIDVGDFSNAVEACLNPTDLQNQIAARQSRLLEVGNADLRSFLERVVSPSIDTAVSKARNQLSNHFAIGLDRKLQILSPSDFGLHNCINETGGGFKFIDFEYFGWDDPVKLVLDFCLHPGVELSISNQKWWLTEMKLVFSSDDYFDQRLRALFPLYVIRWAQIILNEFLIEKVVNRQHARGRYSYDVPAVQAEQLLKAKTMMSQIERRSEFWN